MNPTESPAPGSALCFGAPVSIESSAFPGMLLSGHLHTAGETCPVMFNQARSVCEHWYLLNPHNLADRSPVRYGGTVALSCCARSTCCFSFDPALDIWAVRMVSAMGENEQWTVIDPANPNSREPLGRFSRVGLRWKKRPIFYLSGHPVSGKPSQLDARTTDHCSEWEWFHLMPGGGIVFQKKPRAPKSEGLLQAGEEVVGPGEIAALAGEWQEIEVVSWAAGVRVDRVQFIIPAGGPVGGYVDGRALPLAPAPTRVSLHFTQAGRFPVHMSVFGIGPDGPYRATATTTFVVRLPRIERGAVRSGRVELIESTRKIYKSKWYRTNKLRFTGVPVHGDTYGYVMVAEARPDGPASGGEFRWVQLVRSRREETREDGTSIRRDTHGEFWLDNRCPYNTGRIAFNVLSSTPLSEADGPEQMFFVEGPCETTAYDLRDEFRMFLQWKSQIPNSIWVTVARFDWFWQATVRSLEEPPLDDGTVPPKRWVLVDEETTWTHKPGGSFDKTAPEVRSSELPEWRTVLTSGGYRNPLDPVDEHGQPIFPAWRDPVPLDRPLMAEDTIVMLQFSPHHPDFVPMAQPAPAPLPTERDAEERMDRRFGPKITYRGQTWWTTWAPLATVQAVPYFSSVQRVPPDFKKGNIDLSPPPPGPRGQPGTCWLRVTMAPLGWEPREYWARFARPGLSVGSISEPDRSLEGYRRKLKSLAPEAKILRRQEDDYSLWIIFTGKSPSMAQVDAIAALDQTFSMRRIPDGEPRLPPIDDDSGVLE